MKTLDGIKLAKEIKAEIKQKVSEYTQNQRAPHLAAVLVGENPASKAYVGMKIKDCEQVGFQSTLCKKDENITEQELLDLIHELNQDETLDGFIVQLPLPKHIDEEKILLAIDPKKRCRRVSSAKCGKNDARYGNFFASHTLRNYEIA